MTLSLVAWATQTVYPWTDVRELQWFIGIIFGAGMGGLSFAGKHIMSKAAKRNDEITAKLDKLSDQHDALRKHGDARHEELWERIHAWNTRTQVTLTKLEGQMTAFLDAQPKPRKKP